MAVIQGSEVGGREGKPSTWEGEVWGRDWDEKCLEEPQVLSETSPAFL